jgi:hypothetical protein
MILFWILLTLSYFLPLVVTLVACAYLAFRDYYDPTVIVKPTYKDLMMVISVLPTVNTHAMIEFIKEIIILQKNKRNKSL